MTRWCWSSPLCPVARSTPESRVRTYHARRGRLSSAHREALTTLSGRWQLDVDGPAIDASQVFGRSAPLVLDIGCGMGESTVEQAVTAPDVDIIALDVHTRGVATLLRRIESAGLGNVRTVLGDAVAFIDQRLGPRTVSGARIYFPDPWPKARHHKRRLVQPAFVGLLLDRLAPGGFIHCATDDSEYAEQMLEVFAAIPQLDNPFDGAAPLRIPGAVPRPVTKYERRARRLGHPVVDIWVTRTLSP